MYTTKQFKVTEYIYGNSGETITLLWEFSEIPVNDQKKITKAMDEGLNEVIAPQWGIKQITWDDM